MVAKYKQRQPSIPKEDVNIMDYLPLLHKIINKMARDYGVYVYQYEDELIQEGYIALIAAWNVYKPEKGSYVTIAWLRCHTAMTRCLKKHIRNYSRTNHLEDLQCTAEDNFQSYTWEDMVPSHDIDYEVVARLAIKEDDVVGWALLKLLIDGVQYRSLHIRLGIKAEDVGGHFFRVRSALIETVQELYPEEGQHVT